MRLPTREEAPAAFAPPPPPLDPTSPLGILVTAADTRAAAWAAARLAGRAADDADADEATAWVEARRAPATGEGGA